MFLRADHIDVPSRGSKPPEKPVSCLSDAGQRRLGLLRAAARAGRARPYQSLDMACAAWHAAEDAPRASQQAYETLVRCLPEALKRPLAIYRQGEPSLSFDEAWILSLFDRIAAEDWDSLHFLISSRTPRAARVALRVLLGACQDA